MTMLIFTVSACVSVDMGDISPPGMETSLSVGDEVAPEITSELEGGQSITYFALEAENMFLSPRTVAVTTDTPNSTLNIQIAGNTPLVFLEPADNHLWGLRSRQA